MGIFNRVVSDNGKSFVGEIFHCLYKFLRVKLIRSSAFHPQGNSKIERRMCMIGDSMRAFVAENKKGWSKILPFL